MNLNKNNFKSYCLKIAYLCKNMYQGVLFIKDTNDFIYKFGGRLGAYGFISNGVAGMCLSKLNKNLKIGESFNMEDINFNYHNTFLLFSNKEEIDSFIETLKWLKTNIDNE